MQMHIWLRPYLLKFCMALFAHVWGAQYLDANRQQRIERVTDDILTTDATLDEALTLENLAGLETGWDQRGVGRLGERGAFQIRPWPGTTSAELREWSARGAKEALRRFRLQGIEGYCGCRHPDVAPCPDMIANRTFPARLFRMAFDPPTGEAPQVEVTVNP
jgi:hypothetical protein